jgi:hypothetical protein
MGGEPDTSDCHWQIELVVRQFTSGWAAMSLLHSAKLNGHDPYAYLKDVLTRLPTQHAGRIEELLPHRWRPGIAV